MMARTSRLFRALALSLLVLLAAVAPGCQLLQNEFFYICPTPEPVPKVMSDVLDAPDSP